MASLREKLDASLNLLRSLLDQYPFETIVAAWTGGKDSTVVLDLWRGVLAARLAQGEKIRPVALTLDTGCKFPEVTAFRGLWAAQWDINLTIATPDAQDMPPAPGRDKLACCRALKVLPLAKAIESLGVRVLLTGIRADENPARTGLLPLEERDGYVQANPILQWTEMDVWTYTAQRGLPYCTLYDQGYRSLGCVPCTSKAAGAERSGRDQEKEAGMAQLRALGYF